MPFLFSLGVSVRDAEPMGDRGRRHPIGWWLVRPPPPGPEPPAQGPVRPNWVSRYASPNVPRSTTDWM